MSESQGYTSVTVPVRLVASHGVSRPGFQSVLKGAIASTVPNAAPGTDPFMMHFSAAHVVILGVEVDTFEVGPPVGGSQELAVIFAVEQSEKAIAGFLRHLADALTASFAADQKDPWYGNLVVEIGWAGMRLKRPFAQVASGVVPLDVHASVMMTSEEARPLTPGLLEALSESDLTEIFVEGMRANRPKAKYAAWFIMVEEFERLATEPEFSDRFMPLFPTKAGRKAVAKASGLTGKALERLQQFLGNPNHTVENRAEKLSSLLLAVGIAEVPSLVGKRAVNTTLCEQLIEGRNALAHKGKKVDEDLLYLVLFPLSLHLMNYLNGRSAAAGR